MVALFKQPGKAMRQIEIANTLETLQKLVEGTIDCIYPFVDEIGLVINDEGKLLSLQPNVALASDNKLYDYIAGNLLVVGLKDDDFCSIEQPLLTKCLNLFNKPAAKCILGTQILPVIYTGIQIL